MKRSFVRSLSLSALVMPAWLGCAPAASDNGTPIRVERGQATIVPNVSAEFEIDPTVRGTPDYYALEIAVAGSPTSHLAVWNRQLDGELRAARIGTDGTLLDPLGFHVAWAKSGVVVRAVYDGSEFVVVWYENGNPGTRLMAARVSTTGAVLGSEQELATLPGGTTVGDPASSGSGVLVPLGASSAGIGVLFQPGVGSGSVLDIVAPENRSGLTVGSAAFDGTNYVVAYGNPGVAVTQLSPTGVGSGALSPLGVSATSAPKLEANGPNLAVLYQNAGNLSFTALSPPSTHPLASSVLTTNFDLAPTSGGFWVGYSQSPMGQVHRLAVDASGLVTTSDIVLTSQGPFRGIATSGAQTLVVGGNSQPIPSLLQGRMLSPAQGPFAVTATPDTQVGASIAASDAAFFAVWGEQRERTGASHAIRGGRIAFDGTVLDQGGLSIVLPTTPSTFATPNVGSDGHDFLVSYTSGTRASVIPVSRLGVVGTAKALEPTSSSGSNPNNVRLSFDGTNYLAVWPAGGAIVTPAGDTVSTFAFQTRDDLGVAFNGTHHLVAWVAVTNPGGSPSEFGIFATRVSTAGTVVDSPLTVPLRTPGSQVFGVELLRNGTSWLAAWNEVTGQSAAERAIVGRVINSDLTLGPSRVFSDSVATAYRQLTGATTTGATNWFASLSSPSTDLEQHDVFAERATVDGTLLDGTGFAVSAEADSETGGVLAFGGGRVLAGYLRGDEPPASLVTGTQVRFRFLNDGTGGTGGMGGAAGSGGMSGSAGSATGGSGAVGGEGGAAGAGAGEGGDGGAGEGGSPSTGGSSTGGGGSSTGGSGGTGGSFGGSAGSSGAATGGTSPGGEGGDSGSAGTGPKTPPDDDSGCSCRTTPTRSSASHTFALVFLMLGAGMRRARRRRSGS